MIAQQYTAQARLEQGGDHAQPAEPELSFPLLGGGVLGGRVLKVVGLLQESSVLWGGKGRGPCSPPPPEIQILFRFQALALGTLLEPGC